MKLIYICSPYKAYDGHSVEDNIKNAREWCKTAVFLGLTPVAPHLLFPQFLDDNDSRERFIGMNMGLHLLEKCAEIWVCGLYISEGMAAEIEYAKERKIRTVYVKEGGC